MTPALSCMLFMSKHNKIFRSIVLSITVNMMSIFGGKQRAPQNLLHNQSSSPSSGLFAVRGINKRIALSVNNHWLGRMKLKLNLPGSLTIAPLTAGRYFIFNFSTFRANISARLLAMRFRPSDFRGSGSVTTNTDFCFNQFRLPAMRARFFGMLSTFGTYLLSQRTARIATYDTLI